MANVKLSERKFKVINNTVGSASFMGSDGKKYFFPRRDSFKTVQFDVIENLYNDYPNFITDGHIRFEEKEVYDLLDIQPEVYEKILPHDEIVKILVEGSESELISKIENMPTPIKEKVALIAKGLKIDSKRKIKAIKDTTGFDIEELE